MLRLGKSMPPTPTPNGKAPGTVLSFEGQNWTGGGVALGVSDGVCRLPL